MTARLAEQQSAHRQTMADVDSKRDVINNLTSHSNSEETADLLDR